MPRERLTIFLFSERPPVPLDGGRSHAASPHFKHVMVFPYPIVVVSCRVGGRCYQTMLSLTGHARSDTCQSQHSAY
jgi:hypothetical protein